MASAGVGPGGFIARLAARVAKGALLLIVVATVAWFMARPATPDAFYTHPLPQDAAAGALLKSEEFSESVPPGANGWRILYVTMRGGKRALASAVVVLPRPSSGIALRVVAWAHGTTGIVAGCAPTVLKKPFDKVPDISAIVREGWAFVGTDYPGLGTAGGHAYLIGEDAAHAVLDAVRAARKMKDSTLGDQVVVWGHSQGGNSALWTGMRALQLAPELQVVGVAALAPASDLKGLFDFAKGSIFGKIVSAYLVTAYAQAYPDIRIDDYVRGITRIVADDIANRCVGGYETVLSAIQTQLIPSDGIFIGDPAMGPLGARLSENTPTGIIRAPLLIAQGDADDLVAPDVQKRYVEARCAAGQQVDYRTYPGRDHVSVVAADSALARDIVEWTRDRFEGKAAKSTCAR